jgi:hypothetical protein
MVSYTDKMFIYNHGRRPRGRGNWAFRFDDDKDNIRWYPSEDKYETMLYTEAKKQALADAKKLGIKKVYLLS